MLRLSFGKFVFKIFSPTFFFFLGFHALTASVLTDTDGDGMITFAEFSAFVKACSASCTITDSLIYKLWLNTTQDKGKNDVEEET